MEGGRGRDEVSRDRALANPPFCLTSRWSRPHHRGSFRRGLKRGREEHEGARASGGGLAGRGARLLVPELSLRVLAAPAQLPSVGRPYPLNSLDEITMKGILT
jgi:hypothetical protein